MSRGAMIMLGIAAAFLALITVPLVQTSLYNVAPFPGYRNPGYYVEELRQVPEIDRFYEMYGGHEIEASTRSGKGGITIAFVASEGGRSARLAAYYYMGAPAGFSHYCYEGTYIDPERDIFREGRVTRDCFEEP